MIDEECASGTQPLQSDSCILSGAFRAIPFAMGEVFDLIGLDLGWGTRVSLTGQATPKPSAGYKNLRWGQVLQEKHMGVGGLGSELLSDYIQPNRLPQGPKKGDSKSLLSALLFCCLNYKQNLDKT